MKSYEATEQAYKNGYEQCKKDMANSIKSLLTENFVRCKKCTHSDTLQCSVGYVWCDRMCRYMKEDGFCSFGERKDNG